MTEEKFNEILDARLEKIKNVLAIKAKEYVRNEDRLHNFNVGARLEKKHPSEVLHGMMLKHYISYLDILKDVREKKAVSRNHVDEKIGDLINYLILQECVLVDDAETRETLKATLEKVPVHKMMSETFKENAKNE